MEASATRGSPYVAQGLQGSPTAWLPGWSVSVVKQGSPRITLRIWNQQESLCCADGDAPALCDGVLRRRRAVWPAECTAQEAAQRVPCALLRCRGEGRPNVQDALKLWWRPGGRGLARGHRKVHCTVWSFPQCLGCLVHVLHAYEHTARRMGQHEGWHLVLTTPSPPPYFKGCSNEAGTGGRPLRIMRLPSKGVLEAHVGRRDEPRS